MAASRLTDGRNRRTVAASRDEFERSAGARCRHAPTTADFEGRCKSCCEFIIRGSNLQYIVTCGINNKWPATTSYSSRFFSFFFLELIGRMVIGYKYSTGEQSVTDSR